MTDIFISYSSDDRARAKLFADAFAAAGLNVWWDAGLRAGDAYDQKIEQALRAAKAVVVLWSPTSVASRWVRAEATLADRCKSLVPVTIAPCDKPIMFELTQTADLSH
ncbi:MAG: TIR domain-containing protein, partial [Alphaproteobacteria bacterium]|nr:TIR domain-containing protein [Alphaproteobacteria bacterium]